MANYVSKHSGKQIDAAVAAFLAGDGNGSVEVDATLTQAGKAADAKATGDRLTAISEEIAALNGGVDNATKEKCKKYAALFNNTDNVESFLFFTDPHLVQDSGWEEQFPSYTDFIAKVYNMTPTSFCACGGDWIGNSDTMDAACYKLGLIDGRMRGLIDEYCPIIGNHDTNYQGKLDASSANYTGTLTNETIRNLWFRREGAAYYRYEGATSAMYVLDTGTDSPAMNAYRWQQIDWLAESLKTEKLPNAFIALHIIYNSGESTTVAPLADNAMAVAEAYNSHTTITLNGKTYDFAGCTGAVRFVIGGHTHKDQSGMCHGIPYVITVDTRHNNVPTFDLCLADYDANILHMIRVGSGAGRTISLADGTVVETPDDDENGSNPGEEGGFDKDSLVLLLGMNFTGDNFYNNTKNRSVYVSSKAPEGVTKAIGWSSASSGDYPYSQPYYPIEIPNGATKLVVTCPATVKPVVHSWSVAGWNSGATNEDSGWMSGGGGTYDLPSTVKVFRVLFENLNATDMTDGSFSADQFNLEFI